MPHHKPDEDLLDLERPYFQPSETLDVARYLRPTRNFGGISAGLYETRHALGGISDANQQADAHQFAVMLEESKAHHGWKDGKHFWVPDLQPGVVACIDMRHQWQMERSFSFKSLHLYVPRFAIDSFAQEIGRSAGHPVSGPRLGGHDSITYHLAMILAEVMESSVEAPTLMTDQILAALRTHLASKYTNIVDPAGSSPAVLSEHQVHSLKSLMLDDLERDVGLDDLSTVANMPAESLRRAFTRTFGASPHKWRLQQKAEKARTMVEYSDRPLAEIAALCGFADQSHLTRIFARTFGMPPGRYRRSRRAR